MPMIKNKSKQYLFKNKFNIRRKSKIELIKEAFFMMFFALFLLLITYYIPQKLELIKSLNKNLLEIFNNIMQIIFYSFEILIVLFICISIFTSIFLVLGSINRIVKIFYRKSSKIRIR